MSGLRFKAGELAILAVTLSPSTHYLRGREVEVLAVGPFRPGDRIVGRGCDTVAKVTCDYLIDVGVRGRLLAARDYQLRKLNPPSEPESITRRTELPEELTA